MTAKRFASFALLCLLCAGFAAAEPIRVLVVTGGHDFETSFYTLFEGSPEIKALVDPHPKPYRRGDLRPRFDVLVLYDSMQEITDEERRNLTDFIEAGKGVVVLHHALVDYSDWQWWYEEVVGARWLKKQSDPLVWKSTWRHDVDIAAYPVKDHPILDGVGKFDINDETYKGLWYAPNIDVLLKTDHPTSDGPLVWISPYGKSRVVSIELGHGRRAHMNPAYQRLVKNAIAWAAGRPAIPESLRSDLTFHSGFDGAFDATIARGDKRIYHAPSYKEQEKAQPGIGDADVEIARGEGLRGDALRFKTKNTRALFYKAPGNLDFRPTAWSGTASFWLRLTPEEDLDPGFCDPIQITDKAYNNSAIWVDFTKDERPRHFRLGIFGELKSWNPNNVSGEEESGFAGRLVVEQKHPFTRERWTHVAVTWTNLNGENASGSLYLDGELVGTSNTIAEPFLWDPAKSAIRIGVNYTGLYDELALFQRALTAEEIKELHRNLR